MQQTQLCGCLDAPLHGVLTAMKGKVLLLRGLDRQVAHVMTIRGWARSQLWSLLLFSSKTNKYLRETIKTVPSLQDAQPAGLHRAKGRKAPSENTAQLVLEATNHSGPPESTSAGVH